MPDYTTNDPKGWCGDPRRGAAMGRAAIHDAPKSFTGRIYLRRTYLNSDGYDTNGTYFGHGIQPLYWYASECGEIDAMIRTNSRTDARAFVLNIYPNAKVKK